MTAHAMKGDREECLAAGMDDYLTKPIRLQDMSNKLMELFPSAADVAAGVSSPRGRQALESVSEVVCWERALASTAGDSRLLVEVVGAFLDDTPQLIELAQSAASTGDCQALVAAAHALKGSMLFLDVREALEAADRLENLACDGNIAMARQCLAELNARYANIHAAAKEFVEQH